MTTDETRLVFQHRYLLASIPHALPKFLRSVNWADRDQVGEAYVATTSFPTLTATTTMSTHPPLVAPAFGARCARRYALLHVWEPPDPLTALQVSTDGPCTLCALRKVAPDRVVVPPPPGSCSCWTTTSPTPRSAPTPSPACPPWTTPSWGSTCCS